jgi:hypothetical protein
MKRILCATWMLLLLVAFSSLQTKAKSRHNQPTPTPTPAPNITLAWDPVPATTDPNTNPVGYKLHIGFISGAENQTIDEGNLTTATYTGTAGTLYLSYVTTYNVARVDSPPSNEVSGTAP